jgi:hypothetical protein
LAVSNFDETDSGSSPKSLISALKSVIFGAVSGTCTRSTPDTSGRPD